MWLNSILYEERAIEDERLDLADKDGNYFLGPNLTLRRCHVVTRVPARQLHILPSRFLDCTVEFKKELKNLCWASAFMKGCRFTGRLSSCDFGHWPDYASDCADGGIEDCDFSEARLDACRFHGCDTRTLRFPPWPCFTILDPIDRSHELSRAQWPEWFGTIVIGTLGKSPPSTVAITDHAPTLAKRYGTTPEELKPLLERFDFIIL